MQAYEKIGLFYLGRPVSKDGGRREQYLLYDSKDLVTHAICVGMTGSGKTGLCIDLLEEAAIDGVPSLVIDPKGDLGNLLLTFPSLSAEEFRPWIDEDEARRHDQSPDEWAAAQADAWKKGLAEWDQDGDRIRHLKEAADFAIYTPGSQAGLPLSILDSFAAPAADLVDDSDLMRERVATTVTSLLGLLGIDADPVKSREHILLSTLIDNAWRQGQDLTIASLIQLVQSPPVTRVGVLELEAFYPAEKRFELAMALNNLLAAPGFSAWTEGQALDVQRLLFTPEGKARVSILSIAHLNDAERMFFVTLLLIQVLGWMRKQPGTTSLRAIVYMDEIAGYLPPVAMPASKIPLLTLLKQARAFGVGMVLATQNPVDLDYKALSNAGTWLIGRLQTERDQLRLVDGLESVVSSAGGAFDREATSRTIGSLAKRQFLLHNVHEDRSGHLREPLGDVVPAWSADARADQDADGRSKDKPWRRDFSPAGFNPAVLGATAFGPAALSAASRFHTRSVGALGSPARHLAVLRAGPSRVHVRADDPRHCRRAIHGHEGEDRRDPPGLTRDAAHVGCDSGELGSRTAGRIRSGDPLARPACTRHVQRAARTGKQGEELCRLVEGVRHVALDERDARHLQEPVPRARLECGRERR